MLLKFINGRNNNRKFLTGMYEYITDSAKTDNRLNIAANGCSHNHILEDILVNKKLHNKTNGKQGEHFVISFYPDRPEVSNSELLSIVSEIVETVYPDYLSVTALHLDTKVRHTHTLLDSVNAVTGKKFSQSPSALNRVKHKVNNILKRHGFEIITASTNVFIDRTDYSDADGFDFLELDESDILMQSDLNAIELINDTLEIEEIMSDNYYNLCDYNNFGGIIMDNNYSQPKQEQIPAPTPTVENVPTTAETPKNSYPNTTVVTGPTFRIKGTPQSDLAGLSELVTQTSAYASEHQLEAANLAYALQKKSQDNGYNTNVRVIAGPIFDIDFTGILMNVPIPDIVDLDFDDN